MKIYQWSINHFFLHETSMLYRNELWTVVLKKTFCTASSKKGKSLTFSVELILAERNEGPFAPILLCYRETSSRFVEVCKIKLVRVTSWALLPFYLPLNHLIVKVYLLLNQILVPRLLGFKL